MPADSWKLAPGLNHVGAYQVSGKPYTSGSCLAPASGAASLVVRFPCVTKWFQIEPFQSEGNTELRVAFSENGLHGKGGNNSKQKVKDVPYYEHWRDEWWQGQYVAILEKPESRRNNK